MVDIKSIWGNQTPTEENTIKTRIEEIPQFKCFAATNHLTGNHIFIIETSNKIIYPEFKNFKFKGLLIQVFEFSESKELNIYLLDNHLKDIFSLFIENILNEISACVTEHEAVIEISNVVLKWKKLFDKVNFQGLSDEVQKGLLGELLTLNTLIHEKHPIDSLLESWTGPDFESRDFLIKDIGFEVKFTSAKKPTINISSERQLDNQNLSKLYLILYAAEKVNDKGFSLTSLIEEIRLNIKSNQVSLNSFNEILIKIGYLDSDSENYSNLYKLKNRFIFNVNDDFPKIIASELKTGIFNTTYSIDLSAIEKYKVSAETLSKLLN